MQTPRLAALCGALTAALIPSAHAAPQDPAPPAPLPDKDAWYVVAADVTKGLPTADGPDAVVCTNAVAGDAWDAVAQKLAKGQGAKVWRFSGRDVTTLTDRFRAEGPAHVTFVMPPEFVEANFQWALLPWAAQLDADPFVDFRHGYVTGATPKEAMAFVMRLTTLRDEPMSSRTLEFGPSSRTFARKWPADGARGLDHTKLAHHGVPDLMKHAEEFRGRGLVRFWGHGMPEGIVESVQAAGLKQLPFTDAIVFGGACYTGVVQRAYDKKYERGKPPVILAREVKPEDAFCLSLLRQDVRAYFGALDPDHGVSTLQETGHLYATAGTLGATMKHTYDLLALSLRGERWPMQPYVHGQSRGSMTTSHVMMRGAASRVLFGDPADRPLAKPVREPTAVITWHDGHARLTATLDKSRGISPMFHLFHSGFESKGLMNQKVRVVIDVPETWTTVPVPTATALRNAAGAVPFTQPVAAVEVWRGKRRLHLQVQMPQGIAYKGAVELDVAFSGDVPPAGPMQGATKRTGGLGGPGSTDAPGAPAALAEPERAAIAAGEWLLASVTKGPTGWSWADSAGEDEYQPCLYYGTAGTVLFLANLHALTGEARWKKAALQGARWLQSQAEEVETGLRWPSTYEAGGRTYTRYQEGLYTGTAGIAWLLAELGTRYKQPALLRAARAGADGLCARAIKSEEGWSWTGGSGDIIGGNAGIGCALLDLHRLLGRDEYLQAARETARWLQSQAVHEGELQKWAPGAGRTRHYPGFSHGTAGMVLLFARLHRTTREATWIESARGGAEWLAAHAVTDGDGCKWEHYQPGEKDPKKASGYRTGWCHGPAGTGLGLLAMHAATGEAAWLALAKRSAAWEAEKSGLGTAEPRFWSPSRCCGAAGIAEYQLALYAATKDAVHLERAKQTAQALHGLAQRDGSTLRWTNYNRPDKHGKIYYRTGLQLGVAGAGSAFLTLAAATRAGGKLPKLIVTPDRKW